MLQEGEQTVSHLAVTFSQPFAMRESQSRYYAKSNGTTKTPCEVSRLASAPASPPVVVGSEALAVVPRRVAADLCYVKDIKFHAPVSGR